jgi:hypothetical protein
MSKVTKDRVPSHPALKTVTFKPDISQTKSVPYIDWVIVVKTVAKKSANEDEFIENMITVINGQDPDIDPPATIDESLLNNMIDQACSELRKETKCPINPNSSIIPTSTIQTSSTSIRQQGSWFCSITKVKDAVLKVFQNIKRNLSASSDPYAEYGITSGSKGGRNKRSSKRSNKRSRSNNQSSKKRSNKRSRRNAKKNSSYKL